MMAETFGRAGIGKRVDVRQDRLQRRRFRSEARIRRQRRHPGQVPGARGEAPDCVRHGLGVAPFQAVRDDQDDGTARGPGQARHGEEGLQGVTDAGAAVPVGDEAGSEAQRLLAVLALEGACDAGEPGADGENLDPVGGPHQSMGEAQVRVRARLHRARHVDDEQDGAPARLAAQTRQTEDLAVVADGLLHRPPQIEAGAAPGGDAPVAAPLRQAPGQRALETPQRVGFVGRREAARREGLCRGGGLARLVDLVGGRRLEAAAPVLLHAKVV